MPARAAAKRRRQPAARIPRRPGARPRHGRGAVRRAPGAAEGELVAAAQRAGREETWPRSPRESASRADPRRLPRRCRRGRKDAQFLADAMEALIAAVYLDGGFEAARDFIAALLGAALRGRRRRRARPQDRAAGMGAQARGRPPAYGSTAARAPTMIRSSPSRSQVGERRAEQRQRPLEAAGRAGRGHRAAGARGRVDGRAAEAE